MATPDPARPNDRLVADQYAVDTRRTLPSVGGLAAFGAVDQRSGRSDLMAIQLASAEAAAAARLPGAGGADR